MDIQLRKWCHLLQNWERLCQWWCWPSTQNFKPPLVYMNSKRRSQGPDQTQALYIGFLRVILFFYFWKVSAKESWVVSCHLGLLGFTVTAEGSVMEILFSLDFITERSKRSCKKGKCQTFSAVLGETNDRKQCNTVSSLFLVLSPHAIIHDKHMSKIHFPLISWNRLNQSTIRIN